MMVLSATAPSAQGAPLILNEYNAVSSSRYLDGENYEASAAADVYFGRTQGNGGNWFELVVTEDDLDVREILVDVPCLIGQPRTCRTGPIVSMKRIQEGMVVRQGWIGMLMADQGE